MHLSSLLLCLSLGSLVKCAAGSDWCYTGCPHSPSHWGDISGASCGEKRQSPIDIPTSHVLADPNLHNFTFVNFSSSHAIKSITNTGHTVKCKLGVDEVEVSGGGLNGTYSTIQFHFHWGDTEHHPGSEHTVDGHRYPMEMHIVSLKKGYSVQQATAHLEGIAVLGFFINATEDGNMSGPWDMLTSYLTNVTGTDINLNHTISIDDLIGDVDRTKFYRYMGSLTTPNCSEAVVWTVFQEPINVNKKLIERFPMKTNLINVYRPTQKLNGRQVFASPATPLPPSHPWCYDDHCAFKPSHWHLMPHSHCGGKRQSPINIETSKAVVDEHLDEFTYTKFDDKHAIKYIINTGHTVKCVVKAGLEISKGGLGHDYSTLQFHFHWGATSQGSDGSEHMMNSKRFPMEMHIVNKRKDLTLEEAVKTPNGLAVLGFFIEPKDPDRLYLEAGHRGGRGGYDRGLSQGSAGGHSSGGSFDLGRSGGGISGGGHSGGGHSSSSENPETQSPSDNKAWKKLTHYLSSIQNISSQVNVTEEISIDDLLGDVDRAEYYRYNGSLTTPSCNEAVVWTVFKHSVKVDSDLMMLFPTRAGYHNVYRPTQPLHSRKVYMTKSASSVPGPIMLLLLLASLCAISFHLHL